MSKLLYITETLIYYDVPELFTARDDVGTLYLCLLVDDENEQLTYISTAISRQRLLDFTKGAVDLRHIFESPEIKEWFVSQGLQSPIEAIPWEGSELPEEYLPEEGFVFERSLQGEDIILEEVIEKNNAVVHLIMSDSMGRESIESSDLGDILKLYQVIIEHSYKKSLSERNYRDYEKRVYALPQNYKLRAFAASPGSFNIHLYSTSQLTLFGGSMIEYGLKKFDEITSDFQNEEEFLSSLRSVKGHAISNLKTLMKKMIDTDIKLNHKWLSTNNDGVQINVIDKERATKIYKVLSSSQELSEEIRYFEGFFTQVDVKTKGSWRIKNLEDGKEYSGEAQGGKLKGVTVETVKYKIVCQEIIEEYRVSEKENAKYILKQINMSE